MKVNLKNEYLLLSCLSLFLLVIVLFTDLTIIRTILGLPFVLLLPGYLLTTVLFPKADDLEGLDRLAISVGLSIIIVPLTGFLLNYLPWGIRLLPMMFSINFLNIIIAVLGWCRRERLPKEKRFVLTFEVNFIKWKEGSKEIRFVYTALLITSLSIVVTVFYILLSPKIGDSFTEFYITGSGVAAGYHEQLQVGEYGVVRASVINHEQQKALYRMEIRVDGDLIETMTPISLQHLEKWEETVSFKAAKSNDAVKVEFILFKDSQSSTPYRQLKLWVKVVSPHKS